MAQGQQDECFERSNARASEKPTGFLVVFQGTEAREASADERRAQRQVEKKAVRDAEKAATPEKQSA